MTVKMMLDFLVPILLTSNHHLGDDNHLTLIALTSTTGILSLMYVVIFRHHLEMINDTRVNVVHVQTYLSVKAVHRLRDYMHGELRILKCTVKLANNFKFC